MAKIHDRIEKLRALSGSPNPHEAALAQEEADRLSLKEPDLVAVRRDPAYPHQLPGAIRVPTPIGGW